MLIRQVIVAANVPFVTPIGPVDVEVLIGNKPWQLRGSPELANEALGNATLLARRNNVIRKRLAGDWIPNGHEIPFVVALTKFAIQ